MGQFTGFNPTHVLKSIKVSAPCQLSKMFFSALRAVRDFVSIPLYGVDLEII